MTKTPSRWNVEHIERLAERLAENLAWDLEQIADNRGRLTGIAWSEIRVEEMSDVEIASFLRGFRAFAMAQADWLLETIAPSLPDGDDEAAAKVIRHHCVTPDQIDQEIAGAEGECLHRRHPKKHVFSGRLRKLNETIARIRDFRVRVSDEDSKNYGSDAARNLAQTWYSGPSGAFSEVCDFIRKLDFTRLDEEQRAARARVKMEHEALQRLIARVREAAHQRVKRETERLFARPNGRVA